VLCNFQILNEAVVLQKPRRRGFRGVGFRSMSHDLSKPELTGTNSKFMQVVLGQSEPLAGCCSELLTSLLDVGRSPPSGSCHVSISRTQLTAWQLASLRRGKGESKKGQENWSPLLSLFLIYYHPTSAILCQSC
jgi:hypothetical protein